MRRPLAWMISIGLALLTAAPSPARADDPPAAPAPPVAPAPAAAPAPPAPPAAPDWTPPSDATKSDEGALMGAPLFQPTGETRHFTLTWNPFTLFAVRAQLSFEIMLIEHHALELVGYYGGTRTNEVYPSGQMPASDNSNNLTTLFQNVGGEIGYRWYSGKAGPRGFYVGPSLLLAYGWAIPSVGAGTSSEMDGATITYGNFGGAVDLGWQAILAERWVVGLGGGVQYTVPTHTFPAEEIPSSVYANSGLRPRVAATLGVAF